MCARVDSATKVHIATAVQEIRAGLVPTAMSGGPWSHRAQKVVVFSQVAPREVLAVVSFEKESAMTDVGSLGRLIVLVALGGPVVAGNEIARRDVHSHANPEQVRVTHLALDLRVDFRLRQLRGTAILDVARQPGAAPDAPLVLDTKGLAISAVTSGSESGAGVPLEFRLGKLDPVLGVPLNISLPASVKRVKIEYQTSPEASALQWLDPGRTAGKRQPFLFTQSEAIHARTWIPLQDSPGVRITYDATIRVPPDMTALMSAEHGPGENGVFRFRMTRAIPSYLIALAVGDVAFRPLGPRSGVYAERPVVEGAAYEFAETEAMITQTEKRYGPYRWGRYDLLVLPPSFPFGGMENPMLTFATPTVIAGDRSLISLVAHELAHSWSGNLVSNATWSDFWLNEGFTVYIERRVVEDVFGPERAAMEAAEGFHHLVQGLKRLPTRDQILHIDLSGRDPDEGLTEIAYEKGALFLSALEQAFGRIRFDRFLRGYFDHFAFRSITTADFEAYLKKHLLSEDAEAAAKVDVRQWLYEPGLPPHHPEPKSPRFEAVAQAARDWVDGKVTAREIPTARWSTHEWLHFLTALPEKLSVEKLGELDAAFQLTERKNCEIADLWLLIAIRNRYHPADARVDSFLTTIGRRKYVMPLYGALIETPEGRRHAEELFARARAFYHPITADSVARLLAADHPK